MFYQSQLDEIARTYSAKIALKPKKEWTADEIEKIMLQYAEDVAKIVRDATLRFHEANVKKQPIPQDLVDLPLFRKVHQQPYIPIPPSGSPPPISSVTGNV